ncbi:MAG TPA: hypothetical protein VK574_16290 [Terracidiphilus sp.]|nr:hypothetical protein [Terracidiphilus sp.]
MDSRSLRPSAHLAALVLAICAPFAQTQQLKTINPPGGGTIVYGQVAGQTTEAGAMGAVLRSVHQNVGEKPQVGKLFQVHGTESVAAFFSATRRNGNGGQVAGIIIATKVSSDHVEAALVTDEATRFHRSLPTNMKTLFAAWHPLKDATGASASSGPGASVASLHQQVLPDRSASVSLPDNWRIAPNLSGGGTIVAVGPDGENAFLGLAFPAMDTNNPAVQQTMRQLQAGRLQNTAYARAAYIPYGADMQKTFVFLFNKSRDRGGMPAADFTFSAFAPMQGNGSDHCAHLAGTVDFKDQKGTRDMNGVYCVEQPGRMGSYMTLAYVTTVPMPLAAKQRTTLGAILQSFNVNQSVVNAESAQIAAPAIAQIHAIGAAAAAQAQAAHERNDIQNSSVYQHWDSMDRRSQEFENYQLGYSVISDNQNSAHGTFWNEDADALVKSNPNRFEYVNAPNYWKGIDY